MHLVRLIPMNSIGEDAIYTGDVMEAGVCEMEE